MADLCSPQVASGPLADLGYVEETCYGDIPVDPQLKTARRRSTSLTLTKDEYSSEEIRSDRMVSDSRHGIRRSGGDVVTELSPGGHSDWYEALLGGQWIAAAPIDFTDISLERQTNASVTGDQTFVATAIGDLTAQGLLIGDMVRITGTGDAGVDGKLYQLLAQNGADAIFAPVQPGFDWTGWDKTLTGQLQPQPRSGMSNIYRSFTMERAFSDIGSFITYTGLRANSAAIDLPPTGIATSTFSFVGKDAKPIGQASIDGVQEVVLTEADLGTLAFDSGAGTITATTGDFVAAGIVPGDRVVVSGDGITDPQNRNPRTVIAVSELVLTVAEAIQTSGAAYTGPFEVLKVGLPDYMNPTDEPVLVAVAGALWYDGRPVATVTAMNFSIDNQLAGSEVVGQNTIPASLWGNQCLVTGSLTVLFDRGGIGEMVYNAFDQEEDSTQLYMTLSSPDGTQAMSFVMPRVKINTGAIGDAVAEGLPVTADFRALKPRQGAWAKEGQSQINIIDTGAQGAVAPFAMSLSGGMSGAAALAVAPAGKAPSAPAGQGGGSNQTAKAKKVVQDEAA